jgi:hypothetical protein
MLQPRDVWTMGLQFEMPSQSSTDCIKFDPVQELNQYTLYTPY